MRSDRLIFAGLGLLFTSSSLWAGTTQCANATASVQYYLSTPDGGAPRPPIEHWIVDGQTYAPVGCDMEIGLPCASESSQFVTAEFGDERLLSQKQHGKPGIGNAWFERTYTTRVKVSLADSSKVLADTFMICRQSYHNGLPRP
jgi:hypothetical protein